MKSENSTTMNNVKEKVQMKGLIESDHVVQWLSTDI